MKNSLKHLLLLSLAGAFSTPLFAYTKTDTFRTHLTNDTITQAQPETIPTENPENDLEIIREKFKAYTPKNHDTDLIADRLRCIDSEIGMDYHPLVLSYITDFTLKYRHSSVQLLNKAEFYFPIFDEVLAANNMPKELRNLAIVESALKPTAASYAAAVGLWQFIPGTGKMYGLAQNQWIDERMDLYKSTEAACHYLRDLYNRFGDWQLAMAAYNCGPGRVESAMRASGGRTYWEIYDYLPRQTRNYVPKFIAMTYVTTYSEQHNIYPDRPEVFIPSALVEVNTNTNLYDFAKLFHIRLDHLWKLNPQLKQQILPQNVATYALRIPAQNKEAVEIYSAIQAGNYNAIDRRGAKYQTGKDNATATTKKKMQSFHIVIEGETLVNIATLYQVQIQDIKVWNRLQEDIKVGQVLTIWQ